MDESKFTIPVMYDANGDLKSRWYVQFSYLNPETQKMQRFRYWVSTRYKTKTARRKKALDMQEHYTRRLKQGWSPFKGELVKPDVFDYYLEYDCDGENKNFLKGNVTVIR